MKQVSIATGLSERKYSKPYYNLAPLDTIYLLIYIIVDVVY